MTIKRSVTEPTYPSTGADVANDASSVAISETHSTGNRIPKKTRDRIPKKVRTHGTFRTPGKYQQKISIPKKVIKKKPTVKTEANIFYYFISCMKQLKTVLFEETVGYVDAGYKLLWKFPPVVLGVKLYRRFKDTPVLGHFLQVVKCALNTKMVLLLPLFPVGVVCYKRHQDVPAVICLFLALMYFAKILSNTTEYASEHFGPVFGALLNATFGNLVELIISGTTLSKEDATLTITSLIGSVLSNNLLVVGSCFLFGGLDGIKLRSTRAISNHIFYLITITVLLAIMSEVFVIDSDKSMPFRQNTSQIGATFILISYIVYLIVGTNEEFKQLRKNKQKDMEALTDNSYSSTEDEWDSSSSDEDEAKDDDEDDEDEEIPPKLVCFLALALATAGLAPTANFFVGSLKHLTDDKPISKVFIGLIVLPFAGALPEHISSLIFAYHGEMDLAVSLAIGSSNQILGMVIPIIQFISSHYPATGFNLYFEPYISGYLFVSTIVVISAMIHGLVFRVNILHASLLLFTFGVIIYLTFANG